MKTLQKISTGILFTFLFLNIPYTVNAMVNESDIGYAVVLDAPSTAYAGQTITITGENFSPTGNKVIFKQGTTSLIVADEVSSPDTKTLVFKLTTCTGGETSVCRVAFAPLGKNLISVTNLYHEGVGGKEINIIPAPGVGDSCRDYSTIKDTYLSRGSKGDDVEVLQGSLSMLGYLNEENIDGNFGRGTKAALQKFQKANNLSKTGTFNKATRFVMLKMVDMICNPYDDSQLEKNPTSKMNTYTSKNDVKPYLSFQYPKNPEFKVYDGFDSGQGSQVSYSYYGANGVYKGEVDVVMRAVTLAHLATYEKNYSIYSDPRVTIVSEKNYGMNKMITYQITSNQNMIYYQITDISGDQVRVSKSSSTPDIETLIDVSSIEVK